MGVNKVILLGNLGRDPELRFTPSKVPVCNFSIATGERRKDQSGQWVDHTEWHNVIVFNKTAENCANFLKKGRQVYVEGKIQTRKWKDKEGKDRYTTEILANTVQFVGGKDSKGGGASDGGMGDVSGGPVPMPALASADSIAHGGGSGGAEDAAFDDDDIPF